MNTELKKPAKNDFGKYFFKLMNNTVLGKSMENMKEHRDIKLVTKEKRRNYLVCKSNYHIAKFSTQHLLAAEMKITEILLNKHLYLGLSILTRTK